MKIKPVDNVYFGEHLPPKQHERIKMKEENLPHGVSSESMARWKKMDKSYVVIGLCELRDWLKYNTESAWRNEHRVLSDHDHAYFQQVIERAKDELLED